MLSGPRPGRNTKLGGGAARPWPRRYLAGWRSCAEGEPNLARGDRRAVAEPRALALWSDGGAAPQVYGTRDNDMTTMLLERVRPGTTARETNTDAASAAPLESNRPSRTAAHSAAGPPGSRSVPGEFPTGAPVLDRILSEGFELLE